MARTRLPLGEAVYIRHFQREELSALYAARVVDHTDDGLLVWTPLGSRNWFPYLPDGRQMRHTPLPEWHSADKVWTQHSFQMSVLRWFAPGAPYSVHWFFDADQFDHYYVNIEEPAVVWHNGQYFGVDTVDFDLDVVVQPDLTWRLKDEDDLTSRLRWPEYYWVDDPDHVYDVARQVAALVQARSFPFDGTWCDFKPDPEWAAVVEPTMPACSVVPRHR